MGRVADQTDALAKTAKGAARVDRLRWLRLRSRPLNFAGVVAALAGAFTCSAVLVLFLGEVRGGGAASLLCLFFGGRIVLTRGVFAGVRGRDAGRRDGCSPVVNRSVDPKT